MGTPLHRFLKQNARKLIGGVIGLYIVVEAHLSGVMFQHTVYCSEIRGTLLKDGKPLPGMVIKRTIHSDGFWGDRFEDRATTDGQGKYTFPEVAEYRLFRPSLVSAYPHAAIGIETSYSGIRQIIWAESNRDFRRGSEVGLPVIVLNSEVSEFEVLSGDAHGVNTQISGDKKK